MLDAMTGTIGAGAVGHPMLLDMTGVVAPFGWVAVAFVGGVVVVLLAAMAGERRPRRGPNVAALPRSEQFADATA